MELYPIRLFCLLLLLDKLLASLNNDTLVFLTYLLTSEVVSRSISVSCLGCDVFNVCSLAIQRVELIVHVKLVFIIEFLQLALYDNNITSLELVCRCETFSAKIFSAVNFQFVGCFTII